MVAQAGIMIQRSSKWQWDIDYDHRIKDKLNHTRILCVGTPSSNQGLSSTPCFFSKGTLSRLHSDSYQPFPLEKVRGKQRKRQCQPFVLDPYMAHVSYDSYDHVLVSGHVAK